LSGLAAAYWLRKQGYAVTVLDHRSWQTDMLIRPLATPVHLLGCHHESWKLLRMLDAGRTAYTDSEIPLEFQLADGRIASYRRTGFPRPLHWIVGLLRFTGLSWRDRWSFLSHIERVWEGRISTPSDLDSRIADDWLASIGQSRQAREEIWNPFAQWLTDNSLVRLSAAQFVQAMTKLFGRGSSHSRLIRLGGTLSDRFVEPLTRTLQQFGTNVTAQTDIPFLQFQKDRVTHVQVHNHAQLQADWYVCALPHRHLIALFPERLLTRFSYFSQIGQLTDLTGLTVQFECRRLDSARRLILRSRQPFSQLSLTPSETDVVNVQLSSVGNPSLDELNDTELETLAVAELQTSLPGTTEDAIESITVHRYDHAALSLHPGAATLRPIQKSPIQNLVIAGAWTDTGWPANIESALVSAKRCVEIIRGGTN